MRNERKIVLADIGNTYFHIFDGENIEHLSYKDAIEKYSGETLYYISVKKELDDDLIYILGGGERSHIGGAVVCEPDKEPQVIKLEGHFF